MLEFDTVTGDPYLFSPISSGDVMRAMTSSQWSQYAKGIVKKYTVRLVGWYRAMHASDTRCAILAQGIAAPPKTMRASFITYMKDHTDCPKILAAAARAMKHKGETQSSDHYDSARPRMASRIPPSTCCII